MAAAVILTGGGLIVLGLNGESADAGALVPATLTPRRATTSAGASPAPTGPSPQQRAKARRAGRVKQLDAALRKVAANAPDFSVAVLDRKTGTTYAARGTATYDTASIVKTQILACMLLRAQDADRDPTSGEMALARPMIRTSDNDATTTLFQRLGGRRAISTCNRRLGLTRTTVDSSWGLTRTTVLDQVTLLSKLVDPSGPLDAGSRRTAFTLMNTVVEEQSWGVPSIARTGETTIVKNGWDTRTADDGRWVVNSIGRITSGDVDVSVAVLSHDNASRESGIALIERVAMLTRQHLRY